jgi:hypothetical protein
MLLDLLMDVKSTLPTCEALHSKISQFMVLAFGLDNTVVLFIVFRHLIEEYKLWISNKKEIFTQTDRLNSIND